MNTGVAVPISGSWATTDNITEVAGMAERLGYSSLWTFQRLLSPLGETDEPLLDPQYRSVHDPLAVLAFLAGQTRRVRLGLAIVNLPFYAPVVLAKNLTTIDHLSDGRLDAGLGIGWSTQEFVATGTPYDRRGARADEYLRCLNAIWTHDIVDFAGEFYRVPRSRIDPKPIQSPHPPILLGGTAPAALRRAGQSSSGWISASRADLTTIDTSIAIVKQAAEDAGRDPAALRFICRGSVKVRREERAPLTGTLEQIREDLAGLEAKGVTETFIDLNFDPEIGSPEADPARSMDRAREILESLAPALP